LRRSAASVARFIASVPADATEDAAEFARSPAGWVPGRRRDGQDLLREAFAHYQHQRRVPDAGERAAWILLANLKIGLHEQDAVAAADRRRDRRADRHAEGFSASACIGLRRV
jgi:hypothetical protein